MDPKTIDTFAALVQSPERLRLLLVLTVVRHPRRRAQRVERLEGGAAAPALLRHRTGPVGRHAVRRSRRAHQADPGRGRQAPRQLDRGREGRAFRARLCALLAVVRSRYAGPPGRAGAARRARAPAAGHRAPHRRRALGHRGDDLHARHPRPVRPPRRRHGDQRRQHRRRQDLHPGQRHGARHVLDPGPRGQAVRRPAAAGAARRPRRDRALQPPRHPARARQPAHLVSQARPRLHRRAARADRQQRAPTRSP